ncbi:flagellar hook-length control protein FliK [Rhodovibrionaceae bacterium A322]
MLDTLPVTRTTSASGSAVRTSKADASDFFAQMVAESAARQGNDTSRTRAEDRGAAASRTEGRSVSDQGRSGKAERTDRQDRAVSKDDNDRLDQAEAKAVEDTDKQVSSEPVADKGDAVSDRNTAATSTEDQSADNSGDQATDQENSATASAPSSDAEGATDAPLSDPNAAATAAVLATPSQAGTSQSSGQASAQSKPSASPASVAAAQHPATQQAQVTAAAASQAQQTSQTAKSGSLATGTAAAGDFAWNADMPDSALVQRLMQSQQKQGLSLPAGDRDLEMSLTVERNGQMVLPQDKLGNASSLWALAQNGDQSAGGNFSQLLSTGAATTTGDGTALPGQMAQLTEQGLAAATPVAGKTAESASSFQAALPGDIAAPRGADALTQAAAKPATTTSQPPADQVAVQITKAVNGGKDKISLQLNPAELGRVDVKLDVGTDGSVKAVISVDRPETMDLMQRDSRMLEKALQEAGLKTDSGSLSFNLKGEGQNGQGQETAGNSRGSSAAGDEGTDDQDLAGQPDTSDDPSDWHEGVVSIAV